MPIRDEHLLGYMCSTALPVSRHVNRGALALRSRYLNRNRPLDIVSRRPPSGALRDSAKEIVISLGMPSTLLRDTSEPIHTTNPRNQRRSHRVTTTLRRRVLHIWQGFDLSRGASSSRRLSKFHWQVRTPAPSATTYYCAFYILVLYITK